MRSRRIKKQIWLNDEEEYIMKCKSQAVGMNASDYIRHLIVGYKPKEKPSEQFYEEIKNIRNIGNNINQIARIANAKGVIDVPHLKKEIDKVRDNYDFVIIDCPPSLNMLTVNAMTTADTVLVPIQCEYYALEGLSQLIHTINLVKQRLNPNLELEGVVFTMYDARTNLSLQVVENVKSNLKNTVYKTIIPRNVRLAEAPSYGQPITIYDPRSSGAESYRLLAEEVINREDD